MAIEPSAQLPSTGFIGSQEHVWILKHVSAYYAKGIKPPPELQAREFGFGFTKKIDLRHKAFSTQEQLQAYVRKEIPLFISYSTARYDRPDGRPMARKGFRSAELVFDLDTPPAHDKHKAIACEKCLELVKQDALRLAEDFLEKDFGISKHEMTLNFSGSKGWHVHVNSKAYDELDSTARKQLAEFITGSGVGANMLYKKGKVLHGPSAQDKGWKRKIHSFTHSLLSSEINDLKKAGVRAPLAKLLATNRDRVLRQVDQGNWDPVRGFDKLAPLLVARAVQSQAIPIDKPVTFDTGRLIRLPDTIHGDTGLIAKSVPWPAAARFEPLLHALALSTTNNTEIMPQENAAIEFADRTFELQAQKRAEVPEALAALLLLKHKAILARAAT